LPGTLTVAEIDATMAYAEAEKALATADSGRSAVLRGIPSAVNPIYRRPSRSQPPP
jgi:hypothetical protein